MLPCFLLLISPLFCFSCLLMLPLGFLCPSVCICMDYHTIDCRDQGLPSLPSSFPLDVRKLLAANNHIQTIPADLLLFYGDLIYLDLKNNSLTSIEEGTFISSSRLLFLDLSYNNLTQLDAGVFKSAEKLIKLYLGNNNLSEVHKAAFESLSSLQVLELNNNNLQSLSVTALEALTSLRNIRLDGNPWICDCDFANLFFWIDENAKKLQKVHIRSLKGNTRQISVIKAKVKKKVILESVLIRAFAKTAGRGLR
ncbi:hypothetical protein XELAEV_18035725mg [Xenopus laevis]|uniref:LRRNT domain-containing protein n=1 Tax=Xenopus laevis TaxID=8355 RepID=A0A974CGA7_XENLA|nr:hypothetical protein XELAEV_18035725mg [Xenopus laevis]